MTKTILVVDDELDMLQLLQRSLEKDMDCRVEVASSGEMALDQLDRQAIDLLVTRISWRMSGKRAGNSPVTTSRPRSRTATRKPARARREAETPPP